MAKKQAKNKPKTGVQIKNKKAWFTYEIIETVEAGISLLGTEVKSLRGGQGDLEGSYGRLINGECWLVGCQIAQYEQAGANNHDPHRNRKLLLHKNQINKLRAKLLERGFTLVPLRIYFNDRGIAKVELAVARGKRQYDKRQKLQQDQQKRDVARSMKRYRR